MSVCEREKERVLTVKGRGGGGESAEEAEGGAVPGVEAQEMLI